MEVSHYKAFISYSHEDRAEANWLHGKLENFSLPSHLEYPHARLAPIFKDTAELPASTDLSDELELAISQSEALIVICSPAAARSRWVNNEIELFHRLHPQAPVLCLIVGGEPNSPTAECFPPALKSFTEPLAADIRPGADSRGDARLKIAAGLLGVGFDTLKQRELSRRLRRMTITATAAGTVVVALAVLSTIAFVARDDAQRRQVQAESMIEFMLGDLRQKLEPLGQLDVLDSVADEAMRYFDSLQDSDATDEVLLSRAKALRQMGEIRINQGKLDEAAITFTAALELARELSTRTPEDPQRRYELGQAEFWAGFAFWQSGNFDAAQAHFERYRDRTAELVEKVPDNEEYQLEVAYAHNNLGSLSLASSDARTAVSHFIRAIDITHRLREANPDNDRYLRELLQMISWLGSARQSLGQLQLAHEDFSKQVALSQLLLDRSPQDAGRKEVLLLAEILLGQSARFLGDNQSALASFDSAMRVSRALTELDPTNLRWQRHLARTYWLKGEQARSSNRRSEASSWYLQANAIFEQLVASDPLQVRWRREWVVTLVSLSTLDTDLAEQYLRTAAEVIELLEDTSSAGVLVRVGFACAPAMLNTNADACNAALAELSRSEQNNNNPYVLMARFRVLRLQNPDAAIKVGNRLLEIGYREMEFVRAIRDETVGT